MATITARSQVTHTSPPLEQLWGTLVFNSAIGIVFMLINFPKLLQAITLSLLGNEGMGTVFLDIITSAQLIIDDLVGPNPQFVFQSLLSYSFIGLWIYLVALTIFSLRHGTLTFVALGIIGLLVGIAALHLISWIALIVIMIIQFMVMIMGFMMDIVGIILAFLSPYALWIVLAIAALLILFGFREYIVQIIVGALLVIGAGYLLYRILPVIWGWFLALIYPIVEFIVMLWSRYILPIIVFLWSVVGAILLIGGAIIAILGVLATFGHLVVDQIKSAWHAGNGRKGVMLGAFAIGTGLALIFLTSVANPDLVNSINSGWISSWSLLDDFLGTNLAMSGMADAQLTDSFIKTMPTSIRIFVFQNLTAVNAPLYDTVIFLVVLSISYIGILRHLFPRLADPPESVPVTFYPNEYFAIFGGLLLQVVIIFLQASSESDD